MAFGLGKIVLDGNSRFIYLKFRLNNHKFKVFEMLKGGILTITGGSW
jgi:hypothetical protein